MAVIRPFPGISSGGGIASGQTNDPFLFDGSFDAAWTGGVNIRSHSSALNYQLSAQTISAEKAESTWSTGTLTVDTNITNQRTWQFTAPVLSINGSITVTTAATVYISGPPTNSGAGTLSNAWSLWVDDGNIRVDGGVRVTGADSVPYFEASDGDNVAVSAANEGRIRYNATTQAWQVSANTGAYVPITTSLSGSGAANQVALWSAASTLTGDAGLTFTTSTGALTATQAAASSGSPVFLTFTGASHTALATTVEDTDINFNLAQTKIWADGAISTQRSIRVQFPTWDPGGAITTGTFLSLESPSTWITGSGSTIVAANVVSVGGTTNLGATSASMAYSVITMPAHTVTVTGSTGVTSAAGFAGIRLGAITITDSSAVTVDAAATLYIAGPPAAAGSVTLSNPYSIWVDSGNVRFDGVAFFSAGSAGAPGISFTGDANCGIYSLTSDSISVSVGGGGIARFTGSTLFLGSTSQTATANASEGIHVESTSAPIGVFIHSHNTTAPASVAGMIDWINNGTTANNICIWKWWTFDTNSAYQNVFVEGVRITSHVPGSTTSDRVFWSNVSSGTPTERMTITSGGQVLFGDGSVTAPGLSFISDVNTGIYLVGADNPGIAAGGILIQSWATSGTTITQTAAGSGTPTLFTLTGAAHTALATTVEDTDVNINLAQTKIWADGAITTQRSIRIQFPTWDPGGAISTGTFLNLETPSTWITGSGSTIVVANVMSIGGSTNIGATSTNMAYSVIKMPAHTVTVTGSTQVSPTSIPGFSGLQLGQITVTDASAVTVDAAATVYIAAAPVAAGSVTLTAAYSLWCDAGLARFDGSVTIGGTAIETGSTNTLLIQNGTAPDNGVADTVIMYSSDISAGNTMPSFYCEGTGVIATGQADSASSVRVKMRINGTEVTILCI